MRNSVDDIRKKHALLDVENEIKYQKKVLNSNASEDVKKYAKERIKEMEKEREKILKS